MLVAALRLPPPRPPLSRAQVRKLLCATLAPELRRESVPLNDTVRHLVRIA